MPEDVVFKTQTAKSRSMGSGPRALRRCGESFWRMPVGVNTAFRTALTFMGLSYVVGVQSLARLWPPGAGPLPPKARSGPHPGRQC